MPKNVLVVGMPRSGTSLTAGIFAHNGFYVTEDEDTELVPADPTNPFGYWQAQGMVERNIEVFKAVGYEAHNSWGFEPITAEQIQRIRELEPLPGHREFVEQYDRNSPWVWKDPRLCLTLWYWWPLMAQEKTRVLYLERDVDEVYRSFRRVQFVPPEQESRERVEALAKQHLGSARETLEALDIPYLHVLHSRYFSDPESVAAEIGEFFDVSLTADDLNVRRDLNHSTVTGRLRTVLSSLYMSLPAPMRTALKRLAPPSLRHAIAPEDRYVAGDGRRE